MRQPEDHDIASHASSAASQTMQRSEVERNVLLVMYVLYGLAFFFGITAVAGVIVNHVKLADRLDDISWSHHRWMMRTFWFTVLWSIVCALLMFVIVGAIGFVVLWIWCAYRFVRGVIAFAEHRAVPYPAPMRSTPR